MELRYGELNHVNMWRALKRNEEIVLLLNEDQGEVMDYLVHRMALTSTITLSSPTYTAFSLFALLLGNLSKVYKLWFKYRNLAQLDELKLLYNDLIIEHIEGKSQRAFLLK
jgi:hypothetical protein